MDCNKKSDGSFLFLCTCMIFAATLLSWLLFATEGKVDELKERCKAEAAKTNSEWMFLSNREYECKIKINGSWER